MRLRLPALLAVLLPCVACDQATKAFAVANLQGTGPSRFLGGLFTLTWAENPGAFLGMGRGLPETVRFTVFAVAVGLALTVATIWMLRTRLPLPVFLGGALMLAGGVGNLIDRVSRPGHRVVDFAVLGVGPVRTGVFNVADVHIMLGAALVAFGTWRRRAPDDDVTTTTTTTT
jgi:signal peptidase II